MDLKEIREIIEFMNENDLVEFEFEEKGKRVKLRRAEGRFEMAPVQVPGPPGGNPGPQNDATAVQHSDNDLHEFTSPLVGTFYRASKPGADSFVNVGDEVTPDKLLCIIEAMKVMNEIKSEMSGVIREILVKNGQAVEFGEPLFQIEKKS